jgi:hypothetical protein
LGESKPGAFKFAAPAEFKNISPKGAGDKRPCAGRFRRYLEAERLDLNPRAATEYNGGHANAGSIMDVYRQTLGDCNFPRGVRIGVGCAWPGPESAAEAATDVGTAVCARQGNGDN